MYRADIQLSALSVKTSLSQRVLLKCKVCGDLFVLSTLISFGSSDTSSGIIGPKDILIVQVYNRSHRGSGHCSPQDPCLTSMRHKPGRWPWALEKRREGLEIFNLVADFPRHGQRPYLVSPSRTTTDKVPSGRDLKSFPRRQSNFLIMTSISWSYTDHILKSSLHVFNKS